MPSSADVQEEPSPRGEKARAPRGRLTPRGSFASIRVFRGPPLLLEEADDLAVLVDVHLH